MDDKIKNIVFWQVSPSIHQAPYIRELDELIPGVNIVCVFTRDVSDNRKKMGWLKPDYGNTTILFESDIAGLVEIYKKHFENSVHIFSSILNSRCIRETYLYAIRNKSLLVAILSEGYEIYGFKGFFRKIRRYLYERNLLENLDFVLSIGSHSYDWYAKAGVDKCNIFPFPYVVNCSNNVNEIKQENNLFKIVYVGALTKNKNVSLLLNALASAELSQWELSIVGDGPERNSLEAQSARLGFHERVKFFGTLENSKIHKFLGAHDLLVLPSKWDGWGAVVNEALHAGLYVICSGNCGSSEVILPGINGEVFRSDSTHDLSNLLIKYIESGRISNNARERIKKLSNGIEGKTVATYFVDIIYFNLGVLNQRPDRPWIISS